MQTFLFFKKKKYLGLFFSDRDLSAAKNPQHQGRATKEKLLERHRLQVNIRNSQLVSFVHFSSVFFHLHRFESFGFSTRHTHECRVREF